MFPARFLFALPLCTVKIHIVYIDWKINTNKSTQMLRRLLIRRVVSSKTAAVNLLSSRRRRAILFTLNVYTAFSQNEHLS